MASTMEVGHGRVLPQKGEMLVEAPTIVSPGRFHRVSEFNNEPLNRSVMDRLVEVPTIATQEGIQPR